MNILTIESVLTAEAEVQDLDELANRIDSMHDALTVDPTVLSVDIVTTGGSSIEFLLRAASLEEESLDDAKSRVEHLIHQAFEAAHINISSSSLEGEAQGAVVKEFALV